MNTATIKLLESFDDFAVRELDGQIAEFQDQLAITKSDKKKAFLKSEIAKTKNLRRQILWGV